MNEVAEAAGAPLERSPNMIGADQQAPPHRHINVILNWFEELKERVPTGGR